MVWLLWIPPSCSNGIFFTDHLLHSFSVGLAMNLIKNVQQQKHFHGTNMHFLTDGGLEESCLFGAGGGFHFLLPLPSTKNTLRLVVGSFRKSILCLKIAKTTFCKKSLCLPLFSHTLGIIICTKKKTTSQLKSPFSNKESFLPILLPLKG